MKHTIEITKEAFLAIVGTGVHTQREVETQEHAEFVRYEAMGVWLVAVTNFVSGVTQYYVQDINA